MVSRVAQMNPPSTCWEKSVVTLLEVICILVLLVFLVKNKKSFWIALSWNILVFNPGKKSAWDSRVVTSFLLLKAPEFILVQLQFHHVMHISEGTNNPFHSTKPGRTLAHKSQLHNYGTNKIAWKFREQMRLSSPKEKLRSCWEASWALHVTTEH